MTGLDDGSGQSQPFGYLITAIAIGWMTFFALAPRRRPRWLAQVSFQSGLLVSEQPFYPFYLLLGLTLLAQVEGDLSTEVGGLALALSAAIVLGLATLVMRSTRTAGVLDRALDRGLGHDGRERAGNARRRGIPLGHIVFAPFFTRRHDVRCIRNIRYGDAGRHNLLDLYCRRTRPQGGGVFIFFHGGGFSSGRKSFESRVLLNTLASAGWVCISANYRLGRTARFPDHLVDAKKVIRWARQHASDYGADASALVVGGSSAGAHLASMCALTPDRPEFQPGFEGADTSVSAAVCLYGWFGAVSDHATGSSPHDYLPTTDRSAVPPFFVAHGNHDTLVPVERARDFVARLRSESDALVVYAELPGAQHSFDLFHSIRSDLVVRGIGSFLAAVLIPSRR
ncbi:acetyl esterase/lipase [Okibacterium sp. HSC-33S16]|uniref:alpha/beta hydrolase n=1 Tax=Okibacterium sp. HSC-33S16 TaxID=2910965 RepID=UPI0020A1C395|nr:alpha/beta hydrolase [Okibacterium sp. HSC-33S16]MCP2031355.1 acetyl esterase/lipase [Okibacterium sp. HSC-33S16]